MKICCLLNIFYPHRIASRVLYEVKSLYVLVILLFSTGLTLFAQNDSLPSYFRKYDQEKVLSLLSNIVKTDLCAFIEGNASLSLEHHFSGRFSAEVGLGILLPYTYKIVSSDDTYKQFSHKNPGYSFLLSPKLYGKGFFYYSYLGLIYTYHRYETLAVSEYGIIGGYSWKISKKLILDFSAGCTLFDQKLHKDGTQLMYNKDRFVHIPVAIKIGYIIN